MPPRVFRSAALGLVVVACAVAPAVAQAPRPTITIADRSLVYGESTLLAAQLTNGALDKGRIVELLARGVPAPRYSIVDRGTADAQGKALFVLRPTGDTFYAVRTPVGQKQVSLGFRVRVRPSISVRVSDRTPRHGQRVRFGGIVRPDIDGTRVRIQRRRLGSIYKTIRITRLRDTGGADSFYSAVVRIRASGAYRVVTDQTFTLNPGASAPRFLRVHR